MRKTITSSLTEECRKQLDYWFELQRTQRYTTIELMNSSPNHHDRKIISIIALMDIDKWQLISMLDQEEWAFINACHSYLKRNHLPKVS